MVLTFSFCGFSISIFLNFRFKIIKPGLKLIQDKTDLGYESCRLTYVNLN